jgi:dUTP pyrophosphatase
MNLNLNIKVDDDCFIPRQGTKEAAGYDLIANLNEELITLYPLTTTKIDAGFSMQLPEGYHAKIVSRSGLASKGLVVANAPGIIDSDYNRTRIAQMLIEKHESVIFSKVTQLSETERASGGFGSTGIN